MTVRFVQLGTDRLPGEGLRIGTVRRPPRGVPRTDFAKKNWYDVWYPNLSPTPETMQLGLNSVVDLYEALGGGWYAPADSSAR